MYNSQSRYLPKYKLFIIKASRGDLGHLHIAIYGNVGSLILIWPNFTKIKFQLMQASAIIPYYGDSRLVALDQCTYNTILLPWQPTNHHIWVKGLKRYKHYFRNSLPLPFLHLQACLWHYT